MFKCGVHLNLRIQSLGNWYFSKRGLVNLCVCTNVSISSNYVLAVFYVAEKLRNDEETKKKGVSF